MRRLSLVFVVVVVALIIAIWPRERATAPSEQPRATSAQQPVQRAGVDPCPASAAVTGGVLAGLRLGCLADGAPVDLPALLGGKPALVNLWAYWCEPCAHELPALQAYANRMGGRVTVLTVHSDPNEARALARLRDLSVRLPGVQDGERRVAAALAVPTVLPVSVLLRPDGTVAERVVRPFADVDDVTDTVRAALGVAP